MNIAKPVLCKRFFMISATTRKRSPRDSIFTTLMQVQLKASLHMETNLVTKCNNICVSLHEYRDWKTQLLFQPAVFFLNNNQSLIAAPFIRGLCFMDTFCRALETVVCNLYKEKIITPSKIYSSASILVPMHYTAKFSWRSLSHKPWYCPSNLRKFVEI